MTVRHSGGCGKAWVGSGKDCLIRCFESAFRPKFRGETGPVRVGLPTLVMQQVVVVVVVVVVVASLVVPSAGSNEDREQNQK